MPVNTAYLNTAGAPAGVSNQSQIAGSQASFVNVALSAATVTGVAAFSGQVNSTATVNFNSLTNRFLSKQTTASLTSATLRDGEFTVGAVSTTSCIIYFRSGVTTYRILADSAAVL